MTRHGTPEGFCNREYSTDFPCPIDTDAIDVYSAHNGLGAKHPFPHENGESLVGVLERATGFEPVSPGWSHYSVKRNDPDACH